jgi:hypothetical protein
MGCLWSVALEFKIFKILLSFSIFKKKQIRGGAFSYHNAIAVPGPGLGCAGKIEHAQLALHLG